MRVEAQTLYYPTNAHSVKT